MLTQHLREENFIAKIYINFMPYLNRKQIEDSRREFKTIMLVVINSEIWVLVIWALIQYFKS